MYPSSWQTELKNIGRELQHMSEELRRDVDDVYPQRLEEELLHAKSRITELEQALDLERINHQRTLEKKTRSEWDAPHNNPQKSIGRVHEEEDGARGVLLPMSLTHESEAIHRTTRSLLEAEIQDQRRQILALKEEKRSMKEWLERGVLECKRVSTEVARLTQEVHSKDQTLSELVEQRHVVAELSGQLTEKCKDAEKEIHRLRHERALLEGRFEEHHGRIHLTEDHMKKQATECERLRSEMEILTRKLGEHEDAEISLVGVAATLRQLVYDAQQLRTEVLHGTGQDSISDSEHPQQLQLQQPSQLLHNPIETLPGYYDDDDDQAIGTLRSTSRISRKAAEVLQDNLRTIREKIQERLRKETERPMALQRELTETTTYYQTEMSQLKDRYERELERERQQRHELEMELNLIKEHMIQVNGDEEDVIHSMSKECKTLKERNEFLEKERTRLKEKVNRLKLDWTKVDDTRRRYRQLERERDALQSGLQQIEQENTRLRAYVTSLTDHVRDAVTPPMMYASAQRKLNISAGSGGSPSSMYNGANPAPVYGHLSSNSSVIAESLYGAGGIPPLSVT